MKLQFIFGLLIIFLATCSSEQVPSVDGGIEGQVFINPTCPVMQEGKECPDQTATVEAGKITPVVVTYDSGIR